MSESFSRALFVLTIALWVWAIFDLAYILFKHPNQKIPLSILVLLVPIVGPLIYFEQRGKFIAHSSDKIDEQNF